MRRVIRKGAIICAVAVAASGLASSPALAQWTGTRIGQNARPKDVGKLTDILAECLVQRRPKMVRDWSNLLPGTESEYRFIRGQEGDLDLCLHDDKLVFAGDREMVFEPRAVRNPVALAFARRHLRDIEATPNGLNPDSSPWFTESYTALPDGTAVDEMALALQGFGHCVASSNWQGSRTFILAKPGSAEERSAIGALTPNLGPCIDQKAKMELTTSILRRALAEPIAHILIASGK